MRSGGNNFNYFPENKLTKLANFVQFIHLRMLMFCMDNWGPRPLGPHWLRHCGARPPIGLFHSFRNNTRVCEANNYNS